MFVKVTASGPRRYVQLVESFRDDAGRVKRRTVATLGRVDQLDGELDSVIDGLMKVAGRKPPGFDTKSSKLPIFRVPPQWNQQLSACQMKYL